jgi:3-oxoadipate enol-lactonase
MAVEVAHKVTGAGPPLILIHGIGARKTAFDRLLPQLSGRFTCVTYDLAGHGDSPMPSGRMTLHDLVDDLETLHTALDLGPAHIAGHSLGGMIGPAYARRRPDRVRSLGLWSTAAFRTEDDRARVRAVVAAMRASGVGPVLDTLAARWFTDAFIATRPEVIAARKAQVTGTPEEVFLNVFDIYAETEMAPWLADLRVPAQVITGELDGGCPPRLNARIADALGAELVVLPGLKHAILIEASDVVAPHVGRFLDAQG